MRSKLIGLSLFVIASIAGTAAGCGTSGAALCNAKCECEGCASFQFDQCVAEADGDDRESDFRGCGAEYGNYLACQDATGFCRGRDFDTSCGFEHSVWRDCMDFKRH